MNPMIQYLSTPELRQHIAGLRRDLTAAAERYQAAKQEGDPRLVIEFLRQRSEIVRQLFEAQSASLLTFKREASAATERPLPT